MVLFKDQDTRRYRIFTKGDRAKIRNNIHKIAYFEELILFKER
jgi:hypothetical protein